MILAELASGVALRLEQFGERWILFRQSFLRTRQADLEQAGAEAALPSNECGAPGGAGLLSVEVGEDRAFIGDSVNVGRAVTHLAAIVGADVPVADIVAEDDEDIRLCAWRLRFRTRDCSKGKGRNGEQRSSSQQNVAPVRLSDLTSLLVTHLTFSFGWTEISKMNPVFDQNGSRPGHATADLFPSEPDAQADDRPAHRDVPHEAVILIVDAEMPIADLH